MEFIVCQLNVNKTVKKQKKKIVRFQIIVRFSNKMLTTECSPGRPSLRAAWSLHLLQQHLITRLSCSRTSICSHFCVFLYILQVKLLLFFPFPYTQNIIGAPKRCAGVLRGAGVSLRQQQGSQQGQG